MGFRSDWLMAIAWVSRAAHVRDELRGRRCVFRTKANTDSGARRTVIPGEAERSFRGKPNTDSGHAEQ